MSTSGVSNSFDRIRHGLDSWLVEDTSTGRFMLDRTVFTDPELFELEMKYIFERNWVFLAHESQLANESAFLTLTIGRQPVLLTRNRSGELKCFINACTHRGARLCREKRGRRTTFTCPFHGWTFSNDGALLNVTDEENGAYPEHFDRSDLGLREVGRLESYKGFIFASLSADVPRWTITLRGRRPSSTSWWTSRRKESWRSCEGSGGIPIAATGRCRPRTVSMDIMFRPCIRTTC